MMSYEEARCGIKTGDLLAWRPRTLIGKIISRVTGSTWSHVGVAMWLHDHDRLVVLEASERVGSVGIRSLRELGPFDWVKTPGVWSESMTDWTYSVLGRPYSVVDAIRAGLGIPFVSTGYICSELVGYLIKEQGISLPRDSWTPGYVVERVLDSGGEMKTVGD